MKAALIFFVAALSAVSVQAARFQLADVGKIVKVSDPQISPDGKSIIIVVSRPNYQLDLNETQLVLVDVPTHRQRVLTHDRKGISYPRWSPSGEQLAFLANDVNNKPQIFLMPMNGGDSEQVTKIPTGVQQFAWKPDGSAIAFAASDEAPKREGDAKFDDAFEVGDNDFLVNSKPLPTHLWLVPATGGEAKRLTSGTWTLPISHPPSSPASPIAWSPDGKSIAFVKIATPYSGDADQSTLQLLDVATGKYQPITGRTMRKGYPSFAPDGTHLSYWCPRGGETRNGNGVNVLAGTHGEGEDVTRDIDRNIVRAIWLPDSRGMLVGANDGTTVSLWLQPLTGAASKLNLGKITPVSTFWVDVHVGPHGEIAFAGSEPQRPTELYYLSSTKDVPERLTDFNAPITQLELGNTETIDWTGPDGFKQDGVLTYPPGFQQSRKYPLVLYVHGGPRSASKETFSVFAQLLAAQGWIVFEPNYRGSDNLGTRFQAAIWNDAGDGPGRDAMSGVAEVKKRGFVDESRVAVTGWSYGGYMTTWLLGHYKGWRVAIAGAAVTDWLDQYNLGDANVRRADGFGGSPYTGNRMKAYIDQSPITYVANIAAPTLILSDTGDYRVPITQSYRLYHALKDRGVTTQFFAYPIPGHSPADPVRMRDVYRRWIGWLSQYLGPEANADNSTRTGSQDH
jgi:dipeptidyl aminopeptidase/acylaminoacyl peptidase